MTEKRFTLADDYLIEYDGDYFDLHKPSDIRSLINVIRYVTDENEQLQSEVSKLTDLIASEIEKNARLLQENNSLKIDNMQLKEEIKDLNDVLARYEEKVLKND